MNIKKRLKQRRQANTQVSRLIEAALLCESLRRGNEEADVGDKLGSSGTDPENWGQGAKKGQDTGAVGTVPIEIFHKLDGTGEGAS